MEEPVEEHHRVETFTELLGVDVGYNIMHFGTKIKHVTGLDCPCNPAKIEHTKEN